MEDKMRFIKSLLIGAAIFGTCAVAHAENVNTEKVCINYSEMVTVAVSRKLSGLPEETAIEDLFATFNVYPHGLVTRYSAAGEVEIRKVVGKVYATTDSSRFPSVATFQSAYWRDKLRADCLNGILFGD
jgi:hypothetical protein